MRPARDRISVERGLTLLEVLIALLVLSVGMIGMAALHVSALQNTHSSLYRSLATAIALDFEERMWLELAEDPAGLSCGLLSTAMPGIVGKFEENWQRNTVDGVQTVRLPLMTLIPTVDMGEGFASIRIEIRWVETRLADSVVFVEEDQPLEEFSYLVRIPCRG